MRKPMKVIAIAGGRFTTIEDIKSYCYVDDNGCWVKRNAKAGNKYAHFGVAGQFVTAHRLSWQIANGTIPDGLLVCHRCNNKRCLNPDHLYLGTNQQNIADAARDGLLVGKPKGPTLVNANKTHCLRGHPLFGSNVYVPRSGGRLCRECRRIRNRSINSAKRERARAEKLLSSATAQHKVPKP